MAFPGVWVTPVQPSIADFGLARVAICRKAGRIASQAPLEVRSMASCGCAPSIENEPPPDAGGERRLILYLCIPAATRRWADRTRSPMRVAPHDLYLRARELNPARWSGDTRHWAPIGVVTLNPERDSVIETHLAALDIQTLAA